MESFISLGGGSDEIAFYKQIIDDAMEKVEQMPYAERRAYEMNTSGDDDEYTIEGKRSLLTVQRRSLSLWRRSAPRKRRCAPSSK